MGYQSEAALEQQFIEQLNKQEYANVAIHLQLGQSRYRSLILSLSLKSSDIRMYPLP